MTDSNYYWHIHHSKKNGAQILTCVDGEGWYQEEGKEPQSLKVGDVVIIPANVKHWHGAKMLLIKGLQVIKTQAKVA